MNGGIEMGSNTGIAPENGDGRLERKTKYAVTALVAAGILLILTGAQALAFFSHFTPGINKANTKLADLQIESNRGDLFKAVEQNLNGLAAKADAKGDMAKQIKTLLEEFKSHFRETPLDKIKALRARLPELQQGLNANNGSVGEVEHTLDRLQAVYSDPYKQLYDELDDPAWYLRPLASVLEDRYGYTDAVTYNRAMYLAQIGEIGTARVLLTGLYARAERPELLGLVYYGLGRLQYEQFAANPKPETYMQSVQYLRQSLQANPDLPLATRLFDYLLSLTQRQGIPKSGKGEPTTFTEGNQGAISSEKPLF